MPKMDSQREREKGDKPANITGNSKRPLTKGLRQGNGGGLKIQKSTTKTLLKIKRRLCLKGGRDRTDPGKNLKVSKREQPAPKRYERERILEAWEGFSSYY